MRHQLDTSRTRCTQLEQRGAALESESKRKASAGQRETDAENAAAIAKLKNELEAARRTRLLLEGQLLDRDARAVEVRGEESAVDVICSGSCLDSMNSLMRLLPWYDVWSTLT